MKILKEADSAINFINWLDDIVASFIFNKFCFWETSLFSRFHFIFVYFLEILIFEWLIRNYFIFLPIEIPHFGHSVVRHIWPFLPIECRIFWNRSSRIYTERGSRYYPNEIHFKIAWTHNFEISQPKSRRVLLIKIISRSQSSFWTLVFIIEEPAFHIICIFNNLIIFLKLEGSRLVIITVRI